MQSFQVAEAASWLRSNTFETFVVMLGLAFAANTGCGSGQAIVAADENEPPVITSGPTATPASISDQSSSTITVTATDPNNDPLSYEWSATGGTIQGSGRTATYIPDRVTAEVTNRIDVTVRELNSSNLSVSGSVNVTVTLSGPVVVNLGELTEWTATLAKTNPAGGNALYPTLAAVFQQNASDLSLLAGSNRDNNQEVDLVSTGTVDGTGIILEVVVTNGGSPRATIVFAGTISGPPSDQTITGTYTATGPQAEGGNESGSFTMTHT